MDVKWVSKVAFQKGILIMTQSHCQQALKFQSSDLSS